MSALINTEKQILHGAFQCLAQKGSANVSTRDIAREAGVTLSLIHYYFPNKEELLVAAASDAIKREIAVLQAKLSPLMTLQERVVACIGFIREQFEVEDPRWRKVYFDLLSRAAWSNKIADEVCKLQDDLIAAIRDGVRDTVNYEVDTTACSRVFLAALNGLALQFLNGATKEELDGAYAFLEWTMVSLLSGKVR